MTAILENLINALRDELQQYGEMLAVLDQQRDASVTRRADDLAYSITAVKAQSATIQLSRQTREAWQRQLAESFSRPSDSTFVQLRPLLPEQYQPLVIALVHENNELLSRVRERAQENQQMLRGSLEMLQRFLTTLPLPDHPARLESDETEIITGSQGDPLYRAIA